MSKFEDGAYTELVAPQSFKAIALNNSSVPVTDRKALDDFSKKIAELRRSVGAADAYLDELNNKIRYITAAVLETPGLSLDVSKNLQAITKRLNAVNTQLNGDRTLSRREFETLPSLNSRINGITAGLWATTAAPTQTQYRSYELAAKQFTPMLAEINAIDEEIRKIEQQLEKAGAPYTPGRTPAWRGN